MKLIITYFLLIVSQIIFSQDFDINGKWKAEDIDGNISYFIFNDDSSIILKTGTYTIGGEDFLFNEDESTLQYVLLPQGNNHILQLTITRISDKKVIKTFNFLIEMVSDSFLKIAMDSSNLMLPVKEFTAENTLKLTRL